MSVSPYAVASDAVLKHRQEPNPHPQYALAADVANQLAGKAKTNHTHPASSPVVVAAASSGTLTVHAHVIGDVTGLQAALDGKSATGHGHSISEITNLQSSLDGKAPTAHGHAISDVTNLQSSLDGKAATAHTHAQADVTGLVTALAGKAALSHTHAQSEVTNLVSDLAGKAPTSHTHAQSEVTGLVTALAGKVPTSRVVGGQDSINIATGTDLSADVFLNLEGDTDAPGNNKVYGTNGSGAKGWKNDPAGGGQSDPSYSPGSFTVVTETAKIMSRRLKLTGSQRATLAGTGALRIT